MGTSTRQHCRCQPASLRLPVVRLRSQLHDHPEQRFPHQDHVEVLVVGMMMAVNPRLAPHGPSAVHGHKGPALAVAEHARHPLVVVLVVVRWTQVRVQHPSLVLILLHIDARVTVLLGQLGEACFEKELKPLLVKRITERQLDHHLRRRTGWLGGRPGGLVQDKLDHFGKKGISSLCCW
jgi:hypothetical protein